MIAFWVIVLVGLVWIACSVGSDRRNPPMRKCFACEGDGICGYEVGDGGPPLMRPCVGCDGDGWVEA